MALKTDNDGFLSKVLVRYDRFSLSFKNIFPVKIHSEIVSTSASTSCIFNLVEKTALLISHTQSRLLWKHCLPCQHDHRHLFCQHNSSVLIACQRQVTFCNELGEAHTRVLLEDMLTAGVDQYDLPKKSATIDLLSNGYLTVIATSVMNNEHLTFVKIFELSTEDHEILFLCCFAFRFPCDDFLYPPAVRVAAITSTSLLYIQTHESLFCYDLKTSNIENSKQEIFKASKDLSAEGEPATFQEWDDRFMALVCECRQENKCHIAIYEQGNKLSFVEH